MYFTCALSYGTCVLAPSRVEARNQKARLAPSSVTYWPLTSCYSPVVVCFTAGVCASPDDVVEEDHQQTDDADAPDVPQVSCWEQHRRALEKSVALATWCWLWTTALYKTGYKLNLAVHSYAVSNKFVTNAGVFVQCCLHVPEKANKKMAKACESRQ